MHRGFVGRRADLEALRALVEGFERLVTLVGPPGIGKTRLARELARALGRPTWWCELGPLRTTAEVEDAVAAALGAGSAAAIPEALATTAGILVLDGLEHPEAAARILDGLEAWPDLFVLVTTRGRHRLGGVHHEIAPLAESAELFAAVVREHGGALGADDGPFVDAICAMVDHVPLAIELAAARVPVLGVRGLLRRLQNRFEVLRRARPTGGAHDSLEAAIDAAWEALAPEEAGLLAEASVFPDAFTLEAAEAILAAPGRPVLDVLHALRERSLVAARPSLVPGEVRLRLDASVRVYAARRLGPRAAELEERFAQHFAAQAEAWSRGLEGPEAVTTRQRVLAERENLLAVVDRVRAGPPPSARSAERALRTVVALAPVLLGAGPIESFAELLEPVLRATRASGADARLVVRVLLVRAAVARLRGRSREGAEDLVRALGLARTIGDRHAEGQALGEIGAALEARGDLAGAEQHHQLALDLARAAGDLVEEGNATRRLGVVVTRRGRSDAGLALLERAVALHRATGATWALVDDHVALAAHAVDHGLPAREPLDAALAAARSNGDRRGEAAALALAGLLAHEAGDLDAATAALGAARAAAEALGAHDLVALVQVRAAAVATERGATGEAWALARSAAATVRDAPRTLALVAAHLATIERAAGRPEDARAIVDRATTAVVEGGDVEAARLVAHARALLEGSPAPPLPVRGSADVRAFLRPRATPAREAPPAGALLVGAGGSWFRAPGGERIGLERRRPLALVLERLLDARLADPGGALASETLQRAAWPGERMLATAGAHRVRVAIATLRKLGLRDLLETTPAGYRLAPETPCERA